MRSLIEPAYLSPSIAPFRCKKQKNRNVGSTEHFWGPVFSYWRADGVRRRLSPTQEMYNNSNLTSASGTKREEGSDGIIPDTLVYTVNFSCSHRQELPILEQAGKVAAVTTAIPPALAWESCRRWIWCDRGHCVWAAVQVSEYELIFCSA